MTVAELDQDLKEYGGMLSEAAYEKIAGILRTIEGWKNGVLSNTEAMGRLGLFQMDGGELAQAMSLGQIREYLEARGVRLVD